jgi:hypothetical protein
LAARGLGVREVVGVDSLVEALWGERPRGPLASARRRAPGNQRTLEHKPQLDPCPGRESNPHGLAAREV